MHIRTAVITSLLVGAFVAATAARAAESRDMTGNPAMSPSTQSATPQHERQGGGTKDNGMMGGMGGGMMGRGTMHEGMMGGMMNGCSEMMRGSAMPHLPPGHEKLQLKMQAEIMQKTAEILSKYADQLGDGK